MVAGRWSVSLDRCGIIWIQDAIVLCDLDPIAVWVGNEEVAYSSSAVLEFGHLAAVHSPEFIGCTGKIINLKGDMLDTQALKVVADGGIKRAKRRDLPAVINGLTLEHNSGAVEGNVTRVKRLKRDGYGRAKFDLLRARILLAA
jgi:hypothetical protein